jgi:hypothetical protein
MAIQKQYSDAVRTLAHEFGGVKACELIPTAMAQSPSKAWQKETLSPQDVALIYEAIDNTLKSETDDLVVHLN